jgi:hypothetical protein
VRAVLLVALLGGCQYTGTFECSLAEQCIGPGGTAGSCIAGSCAYTDEDCTAGFRFADSAADEVAGACLESVPPVGCELWTPRHVSACDLPTPIGAIATAATYDTDRGAFDIAVPHTSNVIATTGGDMVRVISVSTFGVSTGITLRVTGSLPLVIAAWDSITIAGRIDAGSERGAVTGPGADATGCTAPTPGAAALALGSSGGGGGGFQGAGGDGGSAGYPMTVMGGMRGGAAAAATLTTRIRGGCPGAASGAAGPGAMTPATAASTAAGGAGGGALQLTAQRSISIPGFLRAGGAGGTGAPIGSSAGGGGGGSGGYLGLEAPMLAISGALVANGGGGGGGATDAAAGGNGADGTSAARGGAGAPNCNGAGGIGATGTTLRGGDANNDARICGGGGGGGGAGVIAVRSAAYVPTAAANISPPISIVP